MRAWLSWFRSPFRAAVPQDLDTSLARTRAKSLLDAVDAGGLPTDPILVNRIGRALGLKVLPSDPMALTIEKIRQALSSSVTNE